MLWDTPLVQAFGLSEAVGPHITHSVSALERRRPRGVRIGETTRERPTPKSGSSHRSPFGERHRPAHVGRSSQCVAWMLWS